MTYHEGKIRELNPHQQKSSVCPPWVAGYPGKAWEG